MNKALILTGVGTGGTVISVGGAYISGAFDGSDIEGNTQNLKIQDALNAFKETGKGNKLVQDHFPNIDGSDKGQELKSDSSEKLSSSATGGNTGINISKLMVNWEKYGCNGGDTGKGGGKIQGLWSIIDGNNGIIFYAEAQSSTQEDGKLDVKGIVYVTEKEDDNGKIKYNKKSVISSPISNGKDNLPEVGDKFKSDADQQVKDYGGFIDDSSELAQSCKSRSSQNPTPTSNFLGSWTGKYEQPAASSNPPENKILVGNKGGMTGLEKFYGKGEMDKFQQKLNNVWFGPGSKVNLDNESIGVKNVATSAT